MCAIRPATSGHRWRRAYLFYSHNPIESIGLYTAHGRTVNPCLLILNQQIARSITTVGIAVMSNAIPLV